MPRILSGGARPQWFDRNPTSIIKAYNNTLAPHGATERWTYTVPANRRALIELLQCGAKRISVAGTPAAVQVYVKVTPNGGSDTYTLYADLTSADNAIGSKEALSSQGTIALEAGDLIHGSTSDGSTTGTVEYVLTAKITEFDA
jgi:hypothetical protein